MVELRIKEILSNKGMTAKYLAQLMGKSPQYVSNIINGKGTSLNTLQEVADKLQVPVSALFADYVQPDNEATLICPRCGQDLSIEVKKK